MNYHGQSLLFKKELAEKVIRDYFKIVVNDPMIGFMFIGKNIERLIEKELELTLNFFDHPVRYTGKSLLDAHRHLGIKGGQFDRRMVLMRQAMVMNNLPEIIIEKWLEHNEMARAIVTNDPQGVCHSAELDNKKGI